MVTTEENTTTLKVVKRNGKKVDFDSSKIAMAIKKGFDSVENRDSESPKYTDKDIQKVKEKVIKHIEKEYKDAEKIKIEEIQDIIEAELKKNNYEDVYKSFSEYRERRAQSRLVFFYY